MSDGYKCSIDVDRLTKSANIIDEIDSFFNTTDLNFFISDIEDTIKNINTNHGNCLSDYKKTIDIVSQDLVDVRNRISKFDNSLDRTIKEFANTDELSNDDIKELSSMYDTSKEKFLNINNSQEFRKVNIATDSSTITQITPSTTENQVNQNVASEDKKINTLPIGIGIAAAGVAASAGAVALDSLNYKNKEKKFNLEEFHPDDEEKSEKESPPDDSDNSGTFEEVLPYKASRDKEMMDKFYSDEND